MTNKKRPILLPLRMSVTLTLTVCLLGSACGMETSESWEQGFQICHSYYINGEIDQSVSCFEQQILISKEPWQRALAYEGLASGYHLKRDYQLELEVLKKGLEAVSQSEGIPEVAVRLLTAYSDLLAQLGEYELSFQYLNQAFVVYDLLEADEPFNSKSGYYLNTIAASIYLSAGQTQVARRLARNAILLESHLPSRSAKMVLAQTFQTDNPEKGVEIMRSLLSDDATDIVAVECNLMLSRLALGDSNSSADCDSAELFLSSANSIYSSIEYPEKDLSQELDEVGVLTSSCINKE